MNFICPQCKGAVAAAGERYECPNCLRTYPLICGIPDFRLWPDPYIGVADDREKGAHLWEAAQSRSFEELLRHYYAITKEDPPDLAAHWIPHSLAEVAIGESVLRESGLGEAGPALLDIGCSTGAMLIAGNRPGRVLAGVDVAFRWLAVGKARLRDAGVEAALVCANAEALPFPDASFDLVTAQDAIEHLRDPVAGISECRRVSRPGAPALWTTNNRFAPLPEPHVHLAGVGWLPRRWQPRYIAFRRAGLHPYAIRMRSAAELSRLFRAGGYATPSITAGPLFAPHWRSPGLVTLLGVYNKIRTLPLVRGLLRGVGPRLWAEARR